MSWERFETKALHSASDSNINQDSRSFLDSISYSIQDFIPLENKEDFYQRLVKRLCEIENTENGILCSSGYLAIYQTILGLTKRGDHILISKTCSISILKIVTNLKEKMGIKFSLIDLSKPRNWKSQLTKKTKLILVETLSIPNLLIPDLESINKFAKSHSLLFILDNSYCTPYLSRLSEIGADCMIYSDALYLDGQSRVSAGVILGKKKLIEKIKEYSIEKETSFSLLNSWLLERGLETLAVRMERQSSNALQVAEYLEKNKVIQNVVYPFLPSYSGYKLALKQMRYGGCFLSFSMEGGVVRGKRFMQNLKKFSNPNQASIRTTILHPASTTHYSLPDKMRLQLGARSNLILLSVGMEHIDDILHHIDQAITNSKIELKLCSRYEE